MRLAPTAEISYQRWPRLWRMVLVAACTLILCSCRVPRQSVCVSRRPSTTPPALPRKAFTGVPVAPGVGPFEPGPEGMELGVPKPYRPEGPWAPPGLAQPWPKDEYLADGGDRGLPAEVAPDWEVRGLDVEDAVAHFDTLDGRTLVEPTNRVHIYSPRFGAVRQVVSLAENEQWRQSAGVHSPSNLVHYEDVQIAATSTQNLQAGYEVDGKLPNVCRTRQGDGALSTAVGPKAFQDAFQPYENLSVIRRGILEESETAWLARGVTAALAWSHTQAVQVILDHQAAMAAISDHKSHTVFTIKEPPADPKLRVVKVASTQFAEPGDPVDFTIRFDNVGNQLIGNVVIIDNLTPRLEYVPDSAQCSIPATFSTQPNEAGSLVLRCEITDPLPVNQGGIIRFRCRVR